MNLKSRSMDYIITKQTNIYFLGKNIVLNYELLNVKMQLFFLFFVFFLYLHGASVVGHAYICYVTCDL